jgi:hypothetical protein
MQNFHEIRWVLQEGKQKPCIQERREPSFSNAELSSNKAKFRLSFYSFVAKHGEESQRNYTIKGQRKRLSPLWLRLKFVTGFNNNFVHPLPSAGVD